MATGRGYSFKLSSPAGIPLNGQKIQIDAALLGKTNQLPFAIKGQDSINTVSRWELDSPDLSENSIAVIPLQGIVFDYDTQNLHNYLRNGRFESFNQRCIASRKYAWRNGDQNRHRI